VAIGVDWEGRRQVLGVELANRESSSSWKEFLSRLKSRGLRETASSRRSAWPARRQESSPNPADEKMGRNLMVHMRSTTTVQIRRSALEGPGKPLKDGLQTAALLVRGETGEGHFHLQITAADDPEQNSDNLLFRMIRISIN
jgi:hypothetical protein